MEIAEARELTAEENRELEMRLAEPETVARRVVGRPFTPGNNANPYGRAGDPAKRTMVTELRRKADRKASRLADALIDTALKGNVRAFVAIRDTAYGVPAQKLVIQRDDDPAAQLLMRMLAAKGLAGLPVSRETLDASDLPALPAPSTDTT